MALTAITGTLATYLQQTRGGVSAGAPYTALVSDLAVGDFLSGTRATVTVAGATTGTAPNQVRALTLTRLGFSWATSLPVASSVAILR